MAKEIKVKEIFVYGPHGEIREESVLKFSSTEEFQKYQFKTSYRLGWENSDTPHYEIINEHEQNNESNKI